MSTSVAPNGAESPPPFWTDVDRKRVYIACCSVTELVQSANTIAKLNAVEQPQAAAIAAYLDQAARACLQESEHIRERLPFVTSIGGTVLRGSREEIDDILDGLDTLLDDTAKGGAL